MTALQVVVAVAADDVTDVLAAVAGRPLVVVVHESVDGEQTVAGTVGSRTSAGTPGADRPAAGATSPATEGPAG